jgi:hypothetical protein
VDVSGPLIFDDADLMIRAAVDGLGLTFPLKSTRRRKSLNTNRITERWDLKEFCDHQSQIARKPSILKRRDVGVVDRARLESDSGEAHRVIPEHLLSQSIQRLPSTRCSSM